MTRRSAFRLAGGLIAAPLVILLLYLIAAWIGSSIPRNSGWQQADEGVAIMVETNGFHTGIVMPVISEVKDWRDTFPAAGMPRADGRMPTHIAIGWGEKDVFLNTPTWADLKPGTVFRILFSGGDGLMRVHYYAWPQPSDNHRPLVLRRDEYARLVAGIEASLPPLPAGQPRISYDSYEAGANNYDALGRYTMIHTCNQWVSDRLAQAGIKTGYWTPLEGGVMKWVEPPQSVD